MISPSPLPAALATAHRPLILDGAMGTMIQSYGLTEDDFRGINTPPPSQGLPIVHASFPELPGQQAGNNDLLCLTRPDIILDIHRRYLAAGADIIETNTFNAQRISLADYHCEHLVRDINLAAARLAREALTTVPEGSPEGSFDEGHSAPRFIVGSIGPTNKSLSMSPDISDPALRSITFDDLTAAYLEQMTALIEGGVDALLIETIFDTLNAKAAIYAAEEAMHTTGIRVPIMLSVTISDTAGRTLSGQTLEAFLVSVLHAAPLSVGLNCSFGAEDMLPHLRRLRQFSSSLAPASPNPCSVAPVPCSVAPVPCSVDPNPCSVDPVPCSVAPNPCSVDPVPCSVDSASPALCSVASSAPVPCTVAGDASAGSPRLFISAYPNAGLPNQLGQYEETPALMAQHVRPFLEEGLVNILGGCCGTTDEHIRAIKQLTTLKPPSPLPLEGESGYHVTVKRTADAHIHSTLPFEEERGGGGLSLSGLEPLFLTPEVGFINVGERCNVAGSRKFLRLIKEQAYDEALSIARQQVEDGAMVLDINLDDGLLDTRAEMCHFLNLLAAEPDICRVPFMIDSSNWEVIRAALRCIQGKAIVNSISLKEGEAVFLDHAREIRRLGAAVIVMAFDEEGQATSYERRIAVCQRAYRLLTEQAAFPPQDIIFDPNILSIATGMPEHDRYALDFIRATRWIKENLPGAHVSGGVSNLSFSFRGNNYLREAMHAVFLYHARQAGMDMAIVNPATKVTYADLPADQLEIIEDAILARKADAAERLTELATDIAEEAQKQSGSQNTQPPSPLPLKGENGMSLSDSIPSSGQMVTTRPLEKERKGGLGKQRGDVSARLIDDLRRGITDALETDLAEALTHYPRAVDIIEGPLMEGMNLVGQLFGEGKMFLPQVVKTARTMKRAVEILQPHIEAQKAVTVPSDSPEGSTSAPRQPRVLVATVKGDVHDIGKNIVSVVMACNGYEIIDLGVMVPAEVIVQKALDLKPDVIGLSGLITPSLEEMVNTVRLLKEAGVHVPVLIGGATTSKLHTALKIAPVYGGPVIHVKDASQNAPVAAQFLNPETSATAQAQLQEEQAALRHEAQPATPLTSLEEARRRKPHIQH